MHMGQSHHVRKKIDLGNGHPNGPLAGYVNLRVAHAPGMPGTFSPPPLLSDPDMHHGTCVTPSRHVRDARAVMHAGIAN